MIFNFNYSFIFSIISLGLIIGAGLFLFFERKLIAISQKRLGISFLGRHGWMHMPADVFKFWIKNISKNVSYGQASVLTILGGYICWTLLSILFLISNINIELSIFDFSIFVYLAYINISTLYLIYIVTSMKSKYSTLAGLRVILLNTYFEVPFNVLFISLYAIYGNYSWSVTNSGNNNLMLLLSSPSIVSVLLIFIIFETKRAPFDHTEAESELVAGHLIEFGGKALLVFFICEYLHVYFAIYFILTFILFTPSEYTYLALLFIN